MFPISNDLVRTHRNFDPALRYQMPWSIYLLLLFQLLDPVELLYTDISGALWPNPADKMIIARGEVTLRIYLILR
jgi:hypothetical protein